MIKIPRQEDTRFAHALGRIRALETNLLDRQKVDRLLDAATPQELINLLQDSDYGAALSELASPFEFEKALKGERRRIYVLIDRLSPDPAIPKALRAKYDFHNLKVLTKASIAEKNFDHALVDLGNVPIPEFKWIMENEKYSKLPSYLSAAFELAVNEYYTENKNPRTISVSIDRSMFLYFAEQSPTEFLRFYRRAEIDLLNLKTLVRLKVMGQESLYHHVKLEGGNIDPSDALNESLESLPQRFYRTPYYNLLEDGISGYKKSGSFNLLEKLIDDFMLEILRQTKYIDMGPEPLIAYFFAKINEIKVVRMIFVGKINKMPREKIRERVPDVF